MWKKLPCVTDESINLEKKNLANHVYQSDCPARHVQNNIHISENKEMEVKWGYFISDHAQIRLDTQI